MSSDPKPPEWDEAQCIAALARLETLQEQLDDLRLCIPQTLELLRTPQPSPAHLVNTFRRTAVSASKDIAAFKTSWESAEVKQLLEQAGKSYKKDANLSPGFQIPVYGWSEEFEKQQRDRPSATNGASNDEPAKSLESMLRIVDEYKAAHPQLQVNFSDESRVVDIYLKLGNAALRFAVSTDNKNEKAPYDTKCTGPLVIAETINRCIAARPNPKDLRYLLDMIAAYGGLSATSCSRCTKTVDKNGLKPLARRKKRDQDAPNNTDMSAWEPIHEGCLP